MRNFRILIIVALALMSAPFGEPRALAATGGRCVELFRPLVEIHERLEKSVIDVDGRSVYFEHFRAKPGKGTAIVFMGLFTPMNDLVAFQREFIKKSKGEGLLIFTYSTQTESLLARLYMQKKELADPTVDLTDLVREATGVVNAAALGGPVTVVGYSYGSAPAVRFALYHRERVSGLILPGPLVEAGDQSSHTLSGKRSLEVMASLNIFFGASILESARERAAQSTADSIVGSHFTSDSSAGKLEPAQVVAALKAQIRAAETFNLLLEVNSNWPPTTMIVGDAEPASRFSLQKEVLTALQEAKVESKLVVIEGGPHAILAAKPKETVVEVLAVMRGKP